MIGLPPVVPGVQFAVAVIGLPLAPLVAARIVGAPGTVAAGAGVTVLDDAEAGPVPMALVAVTVFRQMGGQPVRASHP